MSTPHALNLRIKYESSDNESGFSDRNCIGTVIANNVIITSTACCEGMQDWSVIDSKGANYFENWEMKVDIF